MSNYKLDPKTGKINYHSNSKKTPFIPVIEEKKELIKEVNLELEEITLEQLTKPIEIEEEKKEEEIAKEVIKEIIKQNIELTTKKEEEKKEAIIKKEINKNNTITPKKRKSRKKKNA